MFSHFSYAGWDWVWWVREMVPTLRYTFGQHVIECILKWHCMIGSCATKGVWWWGGVEKQKQLPLSSMEIRWLTPLQVEVVGSAEKVKRTFEDCDITGIKVEMAEKILWNSQDAIERIAHSPVLKSFHSDFLKPVLESWECSLCSLRLRSCCHWSYHSLLIGRVLNWRPCSYEQSDNISGSWTLTPLIKPSTHRKN